MPTEKVKVLIIDDDEPYTTLLKMNLEEKGCYDVRCENESRAACESAAEYRPDIILLDVIMPHADGGDVAHALKQHPHLKDIPVVYVTAVVDSLESRGEVVIMDSGEKMLGKPFRLETLCHCIDELVGSVA